MKKFAAVICGLSGLMMVSGAHANDLLSVYKRALHSDPTYQQAISTHLAATQGIDVARAAILPSVDLAGDGTLTKTHASGGGASPKGTSKSRAYTMTLTATQDLINFADFDTYSQSKITAAAADATFYAAQQDLMIRVATAYFNILKAQEELRYALAKKDVFKRQLEQTQQQYKVGLKTLTDVDLAQSSYDNSVATYIEDQNELQDAREDLRAITGMQYNDINELKDDFPLIKPNPENPKKWVDVAVKQNWSLKSDRLTAQASKKNIDIQEDAGLPTLNVQASYAAANTHSWGDNTSSSTDHTRGPSLALNFDYPVFTGGAVTASTQQAVDQYEADSQGAELTYRTTVNNTRQDYLKIMSTISQIKADRQAIKHGESALEGVFAGYKVGTKTIVDILSAQEELFNAQNQYAKDRFNYITTSLQLKEDTGTLSVQDLRAVNSWLVTPSEAASEFKQPDFKNLPAAQKPDQKKKPTQKPKAVTEPKSAISTAKPAAPVKAQPQKTDDSSNTTQQAKVVKKNPYAVV